MGVQDRIRIIRLLDKINENKKFCDEVGIYDATTFGGEEINKDIPDDVIKISGARG